MELKSYLQTGKHQVDVAKQLLEACEKEFKIVISDYERHKVSASIIIFYTQQDIEEILQQNSRVTDIVRTCKMGEGYFSSIFLPFTDVKGGYRFVEHIEYRLQNEKIAYRFHIDEISDTAKTNLFNFIDNFLFEMENQS